MRSKFFGENGGLAPIAFRCSKLLGKTQPINEMNRSSNQSALVEQPNEAETAYTELFELAQRKFLRQIASFSDTATSKPFPRLFAVDFIEDTMSSLYTSYNTPILSRQSPKIPSPSMKSIISPKLNILSPSVSNRRSQNSDENQSPSLNRYVSQQPNKYCIRALCENENGWHPCGSRIEYETISNIPNDHFAYLIRIMSLVKHSELDLQIIGNNAAKLDELINYIEDSLPSQDENSQTDKSQLLNFKESFSSIKEYIMNKLNSIEKNMYKLASVQTPTSQPLSQNATSNNNDNNSNPNKVEFFDLNRCALPSGKILWLCNECCKQDHVQILTRIEQTKITQYQNDEFNSILYEELKKYSTTNTLDT
jgi:hypothetical protein